VAAWVKAPVQLSRVEIKFAIGRIPTSDHGKIARCTEENRTSSVVDVVDVKLSVMLSEQKSAYPRSHELDVVHYGVTVDRESSKLSRRLTTTSATKRSKS